MVWAASGAVRLDLAFRVCVSAPLYSGLGGVLDCLGVGGSVCEGIEGVRTSPALFMFCDVETEVGFMLLFSRE